MKFFLISHLSKSSPVSWAHGNSMVAVPEGGFLSLAYSRKYVSDLLGVDPTMVTIISFQEISQLQHDELISQMPAVEVQEQRRSQCI